MTFYKINKTILFLFILTLIYSCNGQDNKVGNLKKLATNDTVRSKTGSTDTTLTLLTYGLQWYLQENARNVIAKKWGIRFYAVAGCFITKELEDSVKTNNEKINRLIEQKYGSNWDDEFYKEVDIEYEREKLVVDILDKVNFIKKKNKQLHIEGNGLHYFLSPIEKTTDYQVSVEGWGTIDNKDFWVSFYRMTVNYKTKKYKLIDDKIEKREY